MAVQRDKVIASAEKLVAKGKIEPAIKEYERLLEDNPNDVNTLNRIGDLWVRINRNEEAVKVFGKIADHYSKDGFFLKAIAIYKKINKLDPSKLDIYARLADLYAKQGLAMEAKSQYQVLADYYLKHGDPGNALTIYKKISELDPSSINVHVKLADLYSQNNRTADALKEYDRVGRMLLKRGMLDEAVQVFKKALKIDATNVELVESLVTALLEAKDYENASQIVQTSLESNAGNARLLALSGRISLARGDTAGARAALQSALAADPNEPAVRESLAELDLRQNNADGALEMLTPLAEKALQRGERGAAVEMLNRILRVDAGHAPTLERLVAVYTRLNEETNILSSMSALSEAHVAKGQFEQAAKVLERLIQREPQNAQHRNKLQFVRSQMGGVDTLPQRPKTAQDVPVPLPVELEIEEPAPSFSFDDEPSISLDLDESPPLEIDLSSFSEPAAPAPPPRIEPQLELPAEVPEETNEDLDFITEHLTEAEVFAKYGLAEKAAEHLRAVIERAPKHLPAYDKLFRVLLDEGDVTGARAAATQYLALLDERGDDDTAGAVRNEFSARGHTLAPAVPRVTAPAPAVPAPAAAPPPPPPPPPAAIEDEISFDLDTGAPEFDFSESAPGLEIAAEEPEMLVAEEVVEDIAFDLPTAEEITFDETPAISFEPEPVAEPEPEPAAPTLESPLQFEEPQFEVPAFEAPQFEAPVFEPQQFEAPQFEESPLEEPALEEPAFEAPAFEPAPELEPEPAFAFEPQAPSAEEIGEIDFYIEQELFDEARERLATLSARFPADTMVAKRQQRLETAVAAASAIAAVAAQPAPTPPPAVMTPPVLSRDEIESELLSALPDDEEEEAAPSAPPPPPPPAAVVQFEPPMSVGEESLFSEEGDFFDLAAELESELGEEGEDVSLSEEEQSLEEIFKEFKKGVEQQLDSEDYDTHYNLGIAYKEMGLIDESISEFQLASKDPKRAVECASMLGLCFLEKGMPQLAIKWYRKGLEMPEITEEEHVGLQYDLGSAYMEVGDTDNAQKAFVEVYGRNSNYRDIVSRIKQLEDARK
jgi:tetratricopeptide (TPR) repeat protein